MEFIWILIHLLKNIVHSGFVAFKYKFCKLLRQNIEYLGEMRCPVKVLLDQNTELKTLPTFSRFTVLKRQCSLHPPRATYRNS